MSYLTKCVLTGKMSYRKSLFSSRLILQVEIEEKTRLPRFEGRHPSPPPCPPPGHLDPESWNKQMCDQEESKWLSIRTFLRDASKEDICELSRMGIRL